LPRWIGWKKRLARRPTVELLSSGARENKVTGRLRLSYPS
jgi:hypothetical protein